MVNKTGVDFLGPIRSGSEWDSADSDPTAFIE